MPEFTNPFIGMVPRKMTKEELIRAIRLNISAEHEAVHIYMAHADATDDPLAKKVLIDVANEERIHAGEFERLLKYLAPDEEDFLADGAREVDELKEALETGAESKVEAMLEVEEAGEVASGEEGTEETVEAVEATEEEIPAAPVIAVKTIGSLIDKE